MLPLPHSTPSSVIPQALLERVRKESVIKRERLAMLEPIEGDTRNSIDRLLAHEYVMAVLDHVDAHMLISRKLPDFKSYTDVLISIWPSIRQYSDMQSMTNEVAEHVEDVLRQYVSRPQYLGEIFGPTVPSTHAIHHEAGCPTTGAEVHKAA
jgi:hypothetical protein